MTSSTSIPPEFLYQLARQDRERERSAAVSAMYGEKTATEKILKLYRLLLLNSRVFSLTEIAQELRCSKPTAMRHLRVIGNLEGVALRTEKRSVERGAPESIFWLERNLRENERQALLITADQLRLLQLSRDLAAPLLPVPSLETLDDCLAYAGTLVQQTAPQNKAEGRTQPFILPTLQGGIDYGPFQDVLQKILHATEKRIVCQILYAPPGVPERTHEMAVTGLVSGKQALYLRGWKVADKGTPHAEHPLFLAVHRIKAVDFTCRTHDLANPPEEAGFGLMAGEPFKVRVQVSPGAAAYVRERRFSPDQTLEDTPDGSVILTFTARSEPETLSWALSFGSHLRVLEPAWLADDIRNEAKKLSEFYQTDAQNN